MYTFKDFEVKINEAGEQLKHIARVMTEEGRVDLKRDVEDLQEDLKVLKTKFNRAKRKTAIRVGDLPEQVPFRKKTGSCVYRIVKGKGNLTYGMEDTVENRNLILTVEDAADGGLSPINPDVTVIIEDYGYYLQIKSTQGY